MSTPEQVAARLREVALSIPAHQGAVIARAAAMIADQRATIERLERERDEGFAFKDANNKSLQECIAGEARLKADVATLKQMLRENLMVYAQMTLEDINAAITIALCKSALSTTGATTGEDRGNDPGRPVPHHGSGPAEINVRAPRNGPRHD